MVCKIHQFSAEGATDNKVCVYAVRTILYEAAERGDKEVVRLLLDNGADISLSGAAYMSWQG
jgi:ankyrin repeat protein